MAKPKKKLKKATKRWAQKSVARMQRKGTVGALHRTAGVKPGGKIGKAKLVALLERAGFRLERDQPELLPYQTFLVFRKP